MAKSSTDKKKTVKSGPKTSSRVTGQTVAKSKTGTTRTAKKTPKESVSQEVLAIPDSSKPNFFRKNSLLITVLVAVGLILLLGNKFFIVAWVDKKPITRLEYYNGLDKRYGKDLREELIVEKLLNDEATNRKIVVSSTDIDNEIKKLEEQQGGADKLNQILQIQNISREDLRKLVRLQLLRQRVFGQDVNISNDEVEKYIDSNKEAFASPSGQIDDKTKEQVREQLKQNKVNENFNKWLTEALKSSRVSRN